jgi:soluble lytic murein transglycosylase-like protein
MLLFWRPLALIAFLLALSAQPALARSYSAASRHATHGHYRHDGAFAWNSRQDEGSWQQEDSWQRQGSGQRQDSRRSQESWQQHESWQQQGSWQQNNFASYPAAGGYAEHHPTAYGRRGRQYGEGWSNRSAEQNLGDRPQLRGMAEQQASANGIPVSLVDRVIKRESGGNPRVVSRGNYGLMQIRLGTARAMGYGGSAAGLLDASTNMTYAVRYLAGAYRAAGGNENRAVALYARGYRAAPRVHDTSF